MNKTATQSILTLVFVSGAMAMTTPAAAEGLSANVAVTNNYLWRGVEQTNGKAAVSGGLDYSAQSGFYVGTWASNADWASGMTYELDLYGGFSGQLSSAVSFDVGYIYYAYPDEDSGDADFSEVYGNIGYQGLTLGLAVLADGTGASFGDTLYASADYEFTPRPDLTMNLHVGSYSGDWLAEDYVDYSISLSKSGFTFGLSDTDINGSDVKVFLSYAVDLDL